MVASSSDSPPPRGGVPISLLLLLMCGMAVLATAVGVELAGSSRKIQLAFVVVAGLGIAGIWLRDMTSLLIVAAVIAIAYNRHFYSFDDWLGDFGAGGLYWMPSDPVFGMVALSAGAAALVRRSRGQPRPPDGVEFALLGFIAVMLLSAFAAEQFPPAIFEVMRFTKMLLLYLLMRQLMDARGRLALMVGIGLVICLQFAVSVIQVALGAGDAGLSNLGSTASEMAYRATGTMGHPAFLAPWFLTFAPGFLAFLFARGPLLPRLVGFALGLLALLTMLLTQARAVAAAFALSMAGYAATLVLRGHLAPARAVGISVLGLAAFTLVALPLADRIHDRLIGDFGDSWDFRVEYNKAALEMWAEAPLLGVGPNHFVPNLEQHAPRLHAINQELEQFRHEANTRSAAPVHNAFLLVLSETGIIGFVAWMGFLGALLRLFWVEGRHWADTPEGLLCTGIFWGMCGLLLEQTTDFAMWWDHHITLLILLAAYASGLRNERLARDS